MKKVLAATVMLILIPACGKKQTTSDTPTDCDIETVEQAAPERTSNPFPQGIAWDESDTK